MPEFFLVQSQELHDFSLVTEPAPIQDAGIAGGGLTCYTTLAPGEVLLKQTSTCWTDAYKSVLLKFHLSVSTAVSIVYVTSFHEKGKVKCSEHCRGSWHGLLGSPPQSTENLKGLQPPVFLFSINITLTF